MRPGPRWAKQPDEQAQETVEEWDGKSYVYEKIDTQAAKKLIRLFPAKEQQQISALMEKHLKAGFKDIEAEAQFEVYLPNVSE